MSSTDGMPPALSSMWRALVRGYEAEPRLLVIAFSLSLLAALPDALIALWLKLIPDGVLHHPEVLGMVLRVLVGMNVSEERMADALDVDAPRLDRELRVALDEMHDVWRKPDRITQVKQGLVEGIIWREFDPEIGEVVVGVSNDPGAFGEKAFNTFIPIFD